MVRISQRSVRIDKEAAVPLYEHVFLARQDLSQSQVDALAATATEIVESNGGKVTKTETWGLKGLAYKIKRNRKAPADETVIRIALADKGYITVSTARF